MRDEAPHNHTDTSIDASDEIKPSVNRLQQMVIGLLEERGNYGATRQEIGELLGLAGNTVQPRVWELVRQGVVFDSDDRRKTESGRRARVVKLIKYVPRPYHSKSEERRIAIQKELEL